MAADGARTSRSRCLLVGACSGARSSGAVHASRSSAAGAAARPRRAPAPAARDAHGRPLRRQPRLGPSCCARSSAGPRPAGSPALRALAEPSARGAAARAAIEAGPPAGPAAAEHRRDAARDGARRSSLAAHYDTQGHAGGLRRRQRRRRRARRSCSRLARVLRHAAPGRAPREVRFVLFDGEEAPARTAATSCDLRLRGSRAYAAGHAGELRGARRCSTTSPTATCASCATAAADRRCGRACARGRASGRASAPIVRRPEQGTRSTTTTRRSCDAGVPAIDLIDLPYRSSGTRLQDRSTSPVEASLDAAGEAVAAR